MIQSHSKLLFLIIFILFSSNNSENFYGAKANCAWMDGLTISLYYLDGLNTETCWP